MQVLRRAGAKVTCGILEYKPFHLEGKMKSCYLFFHFELIKSVFKKCIHFFWSSCHLLWNFNAFYIKYCVLHLLCEIALLFFLLWIKFLFLVHAVSEKKMFF